MNLYQGIFNYFGEVHTMWTYAKSEGRAFNYFIVRLHERLDRSRRALLFYFLDENKDNWKIVRR